MAETKNRGFASMDREKQREIASKGGRAAHQQGTAHEFTPDEARAAGRKGGERVSRNREHMSNIGRLGGEASRNSRKRQTNGSSTEEQTMNGEQGTNGMGNGNEHPAQMRNGNGAELMSPTASNGEYGMAER